MRIVQLFTCLICIFYFCGCTVMGLLAGGMMDLKHRGSLKSKEEQLDAGNPLTVELKNGSEIKATFDTIVTLNPKKYKVRYNQYVKLFASKIKYPELYSQYFVQEKMHTFFGFDPEVILFYDAQNDTIEVPLKNSIEIRTLKKRETWTDFVDVLIQNGVPAYHTLYVRQDTTQIAIDTGDIEYIKTETSHNVLVLGALGLAVDLLIINELSDAKFKE